MRLIILTATNGKMAIAQDQVTAVFVHDKTLETMITTTDGETWNVCEPFEEVVEKIQEGK